MSGDYGAKVVDKNVAPVCGYIIMWFICRVSLGVCVCVILHLLCECMCILFIVRCLFLSTVQLEPFVSKMGSLLKASVTVASCGKAEVKLGRLVGGQGGLYLHIYYMHARTHAPQ